jgi:acetyl esterase
MPVKPEVEPILAMIEGAAVPLSELTPTDLRQTYGALSAFSVKDEVASVSDRSIPGPGGDIPVRVYAPAGATGGEVLPVLVWFHGGGWVIGDIESSDPTVRTLANATGSVVVSVDYRLAPEHPFPAGLEDALAAVCWVVDNAAELGVDAGRLAVGGDSAGGNLAAAVAQELCATGPEIRFQLLVYPVTDLHMNTVSYEDNAEGYFLTKETMVWFRGHYVGDDVDIREDPRVSPLLAHDGVFAELPPALVITAEFDPLRDEGEAYGERLRAAGVDATVTRYDGMIHGFFSMRDFLPDGAAAIDEAGHALRKHLA